MNTTASVFNQQAHTRDSYFQGIPWCHTIMLIIVTCIRTNKIVGRQVAPTVTRSRTQLVSQRVCLLHSTIYNKLL